MTELRDTRPLRMRALLKRSEFIVGIAKVLRGLIRDTQVLIWLAAREGKVAEYLKAHPVKKLQLGTSNNLLFGWLNTDVFCNHRTVVYLDATRRFPFNDNTFDYVFSEHMIEHIDYHAGHAMLQECFRVLKPGGRIRIATPDLRVLLALLGEPKAEFQKYYIDWAIRRFAPAVKNNKDVFVINNFFRAWGHQFLYDTQTLQTILSTVGFRELNLFRPRASDDPNLEKLETHGRELESEEINQFETMVIEGRKCMSG
jgi:predicted SAM-dependent methyltransferase